MDHTVSVPESLEVVHQASKEIVGLHRLFVTTQAPRHRDALTVRLDALVDQPLRAARMAAVWAETVFGPLRENFDLDDPNAGIFVAPTSTDEELERGEVLVGAFATAVLRRDATMAGQVMHELATDEPKQLRIFLGLLLAMVSNAA